MRINDILILSQKNLIRAKLRTALTVGAVFVGVLTISLTNGVGNGIRSYVDDQLGTIGVENTLLVQAQQPQQNPVANDVTVYDPNQNLGTFNVALIGNDDAERIAGVPGIRSVTPFRDVQIEYLTSGGERYQATVAQYIEGLEIGMAAGTLLTSGHPYDITIPIRYIEPLGFASPQDAIGKTITLAYKDIQDRLIERPVTIVGVQEPSLLGSADTAISVELATEIYDSQTRGIASLEGQYPVMIVQYDPTYDANDVENIKMTLEDMGYRAQTIEDQIGIISKVIDAILLVLNGFGVIALLAASFGIVNTLLMAVNERTSEIGLMKALGADRRTIFAIFSAEAASIGFWGGFLGILASLGIGSIANRLAENTFLSDLVGLQILSFPIVGSLLTLVGVMVLAFLAGALPSLKASRMDPIDALRYE